MVHSPIDTAEADDVVSVAAAAVVGFLVVGLVVGFLVVGFLVVCTGILQQYPDSTALSHVSGRHKS